MDQHVFLKRSTIVIAFKFNESLDICVNVETGPSFGRRLEEGGGRGLVLRGITSVI